jgi:trehalose synthase
MVGVMSAFVDFVLPEHPQAFLLLVGPNVHGVSDDPEEGLAYDECLSRWRALPHMARSRVQIVCLPVRDVQENAAMVNALQTHATVITQKSLQEGFGLTVTEALWKKKPVVASAVGGIKDQIESGKQGLLIRNPHDLEQFGRSINQILSDESLGTSLAAQGHEKVQQCFLALRHVRDYMDLFLRVGQQDGEVDQ